MIVAVASLLVFTLEPARAEGNYLPTFAMIAFYWSSVPYAVYCLLKFFYTDKHKQMQSLSKKLNADTALP